MKIHEIFRQILCIAFLFLLNNMQHARVCTLTHVSVIDIIYLYGKLIILSTFKSVAPYLRILVLASIWTYGLYEVK